MCKEAATSNDDDEGMKEGEAVNTNKGEISGMEKERWSVNGGRVESGSLWCGTRGRTLVVGGSHRYRRKIDHGGTVMVQASALRWTL